MASTGLNPEDLERLKTFIKTCEKLPQVLWIPELKFFRDYIQTLGGTIPPAEAAFNATDDSKSSTEDTSSKKMDDTPAPAEESEESDVDLDNEGVLEPESVEFPEMGDSSKLVSEEDEIEAGEKRSEAMAAMSEGDLDKAVDLFTEAIKINPSSAMMYAKRANILLKQKRVKAALRDCEEAVRLNPDSATAHKYRGRAYRLLGQWLEAAQDLRLACKLDFDEQSHEWLKEVEPNANKLEEHNRKYARKNQEKELKEKQERIRKAKEEHKKAQEEEEQRRKAESAMPGGFPGMGGMPGGFPGMGGMPGGFPGMGGMPGGMGGMPGGMGGMPGGMGGMPGDDGGMPGGAGGMPAGMPDISAMMDPEIIGLMQDPEVAAAFQDVSMNPQNLLKYKDNPKVALVIEKLKQKFGGTVPGGCPAGAGNPPPPPPPSSADDLD